MYIILVEIPERWGGGYFCVQKMEIPSMVGVYMDIIFLDPSNPNDIELISSLTNGSCVLNIKTSAVEC